MNAPTKPVTPQRAAELTSMRNMEWSLEEYRALAERYADAVQAMQIAIANENFASMRKAALALHEICNQTSGLNLGLRHAIQKASGVQP
ncbi:MAG: hypothetical protein NVS3B5_01500 [Sphingomicrobium sp.]